MNTPPGFAGDEQNLDVWFIELATTVVHRWAGPCRPRGRVAPWSPAMAGLDDKICPQCFPDGIPA